MQKNKTKKSSLLCAAFLILFFIYLICSVPVYANSYDCSAGKHDYVITIKEPSESKDGTKTYTCKICGHTFSKNLPSTGHDWSGWIVAKEATCIETGYEYRYCMKHSNDNHREEKTLSKTGHKYIETYTPPSCENDGLKTFTCEYCGDTYTKPEKPATGHKYIENIIKEANCTADGEKKFTCSMCGDSYSEITPRSEGHQYIEIITVEPDCEHNGEKRFDCKFCGDSYTEEIAALGHSYGEWVTERESTSKQNGIKYKVCSHNKNHIIEEKLPLLIEETFPNIWDLVFIPFTLVTAAGFSALIYSDCADIIWDKKKAITLNEWLKQNLWK